MRQWLGFGERGGLDAVLITRRGRGRRGDLDDFDLWLDGWSAYDTFGCRGFSYWLLDRKDGRARGTRGIGWAGNWLGSRIRCAYHCCFNPDCVGINGC